jgi:hypothetical protein
MAKFDPKGEVSPAVAAIVIILVLAIVGLLVWYFVYREPTQPPMMPTAPGNQMPPTQGPNTAPGTPTTPQAPLNP